MNKSEAESLVAAAAVTDRGEAWGERRWEINLIGPLSHVISVHAETEDQARAAAVDFLVAEEPEAA